MKKKCNLFSDRSYLFKNLHAFHIHKGKRSVIASSVKTASSQTVNSSSINTGMDESFDASDNKVKHSSHLRRIAVNIDEDLFIRLKAYSVFSGTTMSDVIIKGLENILKDVDLMKISQDFLNK